MKKKQRMQAPVQKNEIYTATITGMTHEGSGVTKINDFAVFVPQTAIGDVVEVKLVKVLKSYAFGIAVNIVTPSTDRIAPNCDVFHTCGGCCYRHISYDAELTLKQQLVADNFKRLGNIDLDPMPIVGSQKVDGYRNKAQFPLGVDQTGKAITGFYAPRSHRIISCLDCKLLPDVFNEIAKALLALIDQYELPVYNESTRQGVLRHLYLRRAEQTGQIMVCLVSAKKKIPHTAEICKALVAQFPDIQSIVLNYNPRTDNVILGTQCFTLYGDDHITDLLCGVKVEISPLSFYQVNHDQAQALYKEALSYADLTDKVLLDLYCGIGTIGLSAADKVAQLIGVEIVPQAIENAKRNADLNQLTNTRFLCGDCKDAVATLESEQITPDVIVVDPPRRGCDTEVLDTLVRLSPKHIIMISCNPATAARDCMLLEQQGYLVQQYRPYDLFPCTPHVECAVLLTK